ncbi:alpha-L-fucosidase [Vibrio scophthalmi]|uniref:alpha-L-fucosidase n=1 Tax=Vibrio scophthalmi TaxID=45658 RepID=A0A1C7FFF6_9VIBR|nr:alpha-L-fucosidase [Vibrio scophthalmi]ANU38143.1 Alpha-L-fucosidase [Vibrio scophthalmi]
MYTNFPENLGNPQWFVDARFGMFIHFGLYSLPARHEWVMTLEEIEAENYQKYFDNFNPDLFEPKELAKLAKKSGFKYVVFTAKHHDGFAMWDSKYTDYKVTNTPYKKDIMKEVIDAFRSEGIEIGLYYSLIDWNHADFKIDGYHPDRNRVDLEKESQKDMTKYQQFIKNQITELLTEYGDISYLWFDFSYENKFKDHLKGKGKNDWDSENLEKLILELQPNIILNDRLDLKRGVTTHEQYQRAKSSSEDKVVWEGCQTLNGSWGYHRDNDNFKTSEMIIKMLIDTVSNDGNLLLNIGPNARGQIDKTSRKLLGEIGEWMGLHSKSIYKSEGSTVTPPADCRYTIRDNKLYLHIFSWPYRTLTLKNIPKKVKYAQLLNDYSELKVIEAGV